MAGATKTINHDAIRKWIEKRSGHPAVVNEARGKSGGGLLRIDFDEPGGDDDERLERIGWDEFFRVFDKNNLTFLHDEDGGSRFNKFVEKESTHS